MNSDLSIYWSFPRTLYRFCGCALWLFIASNWAHGQLPKVNPPSRGVGISFETAATVQLRVFWGNPEGEGVSGTGFQVEVKGRRFIVSNRHVLCHAPKLVWAPESKPSVLPVGLLVNYPTSAGYRAGFINPYDTNGVTIVIAHPQYDLAMFEFPPPPDSIASVIDPFPLDPPAPRLGRRAFVVGYPHGFGTLGAPIRKSGFIASEPDILPTLNLEGIGEVKDAPALFIDGTFRQGMSGSPVFLELDMFTESGQVLVQNLGGPSFLGVYSAIVAPIELQVVWRREALRQLFDQVK